MAWEWVQPVATSVATLGAGVAGIVATYKAGARQQETALTVARQQAEAQLSTAHEERHQRRLELAYTELLMTLSHVYDWVLKVYPMMTQTAEEYTMPLMPELPDRIKAEAIMTAYWSAEVEQLLDDWREAVIKVRDAGIGIGLARTTEEHGQESGIDQWDLVRDLPRRKESVWLADQRVRKQVRFELLARSDSN